MVRKVSQDSRIVMFGPGGKRYSVPFGRLREQQMRHGEQYRDLVLTQIRSGIDPTRKDLAEALRELPVKRRARVSGDGDGGLVAELEDYAGTAAEEADTATLIDYVVRTYVLESRPQRSGPKSTRSLEEDFRICAAYLDAKLELIDARGGVDDVRDIEETARRRAAAVADRPIKNTRTVKRIVDALRARVESDKVK